MNKHLRYRIYFPQDANNTAATPRKENLTILFHPPVNAFQKTIISKPMAKKEKRKEIIFDMSLFYPYFESI